MGHPVGARALREEWGGSTACQGAKLEGPMFGEDAGRTQEKTHAEVLPNGELLYKFLALKS